MRATWAWAGAAVLVFCLSPAAQARDNARERHDESNSRRAEERHPSHGDRHADREQRNNNRADQSRSGGGGWTRERNDERPSSHVERHDTRSWTNTDRHDDHSSRGFVRSDNNAWRGSDHRDDRRWREAARHDSHGGWRAYGYGPRYPTYYRYGYYHSHGYYFPRYYFDFQAYPTHASIRIQADPAEAEVYVDGYFAGVVDDFDGIFQRLNVAPGRHEIALRLDGYQTWTAEVFATPDSTLNLRHQMVPGPSEPYDEGDRRGVSAGPDGPEGPDGPPEYEPPQ